MNRLNPQVDLYLADGCGRCKYYATPNCKVKKWQQELEILRQIVLESGLIEELKWGVPCYTYDDKNIAVVSAFKDYCSISFFKGALIIDNYNMLEKTSESMQSARFVKFRNPSEIISAAPILRSYIKQATDNEKANKKVEFKQNIEEEPDELLRAFENKSGLKEAFYALTPGRRRGYIIYFLQAKQSNTRTARIEKCMDKIIRGEGLNDR